MTELKSVINLIPTVYRKRADKKQLNELIELIDGIVGRGELKLYAEDDQSLSDVKYGLYERSHSFDALVSLSQVEEMYYSGKLKLIFDGSIESYIKWFCNKFGIFFDHAWVNSLDKVNKENNEAEILTVSEVFEKLRLCLFLTRKKGTLEGMLGYLNVYLPVVSQAKKSEASDVNLQDMSFEKHHVQVYSGADVENENISKYVKNGKSFVVVYDREHLKPENSKQGYDFKVQVVYDGSEPHELARLIEATKNIVSREKPAHTQYCLHVVAKGWQFEDELNRSILGKTTMVSGEYEAIYY